MVSVRLCRAPHAGLLWRWCWPIGVPKFFGHARDFAQRCDQRGAEKLLEGFGVLEIVEDDAGGA